MKLGFETGYTEGYWGTWPWTTMYGGSEHIVVEVACALAQDHEVTVRLPYRTDERVWRGVRWVGLDHRPERYDRLFCFDDFAQRDRGDVEGLVACRSDPPQHTEFDVLIFLSKHHARLMGFPDSPAVGGGVSLAEYAGSLPRVERRVICTSSPDRCKAAPVIGRSFDFVHSYRPVPGLPPTVELSRPELVQLQRTARVLIYPYEPTRESDFFSMATLEALSAGTPVVISDGPSLVELWGDVATVLPRPIDYGAWYEAIVELMENKRLWKKRSDDGILLAARYDWPQVARRYLDALTT